MKRHTEIGAQILADTGSPVLEVGREIALYHHERWNGGGYHGLKREAIPLAARIVSVVDVYDALANARPYKAAWSVDEAMAEIMRQRRKQFDPAVVDAFARVVRRFGAEGVARGRLPVASRVA
jgi:putative two-component system response regulator